MPIPHSFYAPYRPPLTDYEKEELAATMDEQREYEATHQGRAADHVEVAMGDGGERGAASPIVTKYIFFANEHATEQLNGWAVPDDPDICDRYPNVDPAGKFCEVDMAFGQREQAVRAALLSRPAEVRQFVTEMLDRAGRARALVGPDGRPIADPVRAMRQEMSSDCMSICMNERASKLCHDETASRILAQEAVSQARGSAAIKRYDAFMTTMEQLAGLKGGPIAAVSRDDLQRNMGVAIPPAVESLRTAPDVVPSGIDINFPNFDNQVAQRFFSNPRHWGVKYSDMPKDVVNVEKAVNGIDRYAAATADNTISAIFRSTERNFGGTAPDDLNRANLLIVDGKLVSDMLRESHAQAFNSGRTTQSYADWFKENARRETARIVGAGLMAGKRVEAFIPDATGKLPPEPVQVTKSGYEPKPMQPVILSAWERFASKLGFYKEKVAAKQEYDRAMAGRARAQQAYEKGIANHDIRQVQRTAEGLRAVSNDNLRAMFFADKEPELRSVHNDTFRVDRTAPTSTCICALAIRGHAITDILDPTKLKAEKSAIAAEYIARAKAHDSQWLGEQYYHGAKKLVEFVNNFDRTHDLTDMRTAIRHLPLIETVAHTSFDIYQEKDIGQAVLSTIQAADKATGGGGVKARDEVLDACASLGTYTSTLARGVRVQERMLRETPGIKGLDILPAMEAYAANRVLANARAAAPDKPLGQLVQFSELLNTAAVHMHAGGMQGLMDLVEKKPEAHRAIAQQIADGSLFRDAKISIEHQVTSVRRAPIQELRDENGKLTGIQKEPDFNKHPRVEARMNHMKIDELTVRLGKTPVTLGAKQAPKKETGGRTK